MKFGFLAAAAALAIAAQTASAQPLVVRQPSTGGFTFGGSVSPGGFTLGGVYSSGPRYYSAPYAGPVLVPVRPVVPVGPVFAPPVYVQPYYGSPYHHHHHHGYPRW